MSGCTSTHGRQFALPLRLCSSISNLTTASRDLSFPSFTVYSAPIFRSALLEPSVIFIVEVIVVCSVYIRYQNSYKFSGISEISGILDIFDQDAPLSNPQESFNVEF